jgi:hypothetical protein
LYCRHQAEGESEELFWAAVVSLNHVKDYRKSGSAKSGDQSSLKPLESIANAFKHARPQRSGSKVYPASLRADFFSIPDFFAEPNILASWVIEVDGGTYSIGPILKAVVELYMADQHRGE